VRVRLPIAAMALIIASMVVVSGCGSKADMSMPPLTPEPTVPLPPEDGAVLRQSYPARVVLYRYLRGVAAADVRACVYLAPAYARATFGRTGCRAWVAQAGRHMAPADLVALRQVTVPAATPGPGRGSYTVEFTDLQWSTGRPEPGGVLRSRYVIRSYGARWRISA
jgi:hypothetical protein